MSGNHHARFALAPITALLLTHCSDSDSPSEPAPPPQITVAESPSGLTVRLDQKVYDEGDAPSARLSFGGPLPADPGSIAFVGATSSDVEVAALVAGPDGFIAVAPTIAFGDAATPNDGVLTVPAGDLVHALYFVDRAQLSPDVIVEDMVFDVAVTAGEGDGTNAQRIDASVALTPDEQSPPPGGRPSGTVVVGDSLPVEVASRELIVSVSAPDDLNDFLQRTGGTVAGAPIETDEGTTHYRVTIDPNAYNEEGLPTLRTLVEESGPIIASNSEVLKLYTAAISLRLEGYRVAVNPRLQWFGPPTASELGTSVTDTMRMVPAPGVTGPCVPDDPDRPCINNVPALWAHMALVGANTRRVNVAVLDHGFAPNEDFRPRSDGTFQECDMTASPPVCGPGAALGLPSVGNSLFGGRSWHGTGVVTVAGGVVNNGWWSAGVGGQVVVPMLYKYDLAGFAFDIGDGMRRAVDDGASCINISAGYPCNILTVGPDFNICSPSGRAGICAVVAATSASAAAAVCAATSFIPLFGAIACAVTSGAAVVTTGACVSTLAIGNPVSPMQWAARYARDNGVVIVASAGNALLPEALPEVVRDVVDLSDFRLERWRTMPAALANVIAVSAVDSDRRNTQFFGDAVDVWAPVSSSYSAPSDPANSSSMPEAAFIGATSGAAPFVTGTIAAMMAANPELDPQNPALSADQRRMIVLRFQELMRSDEATLDEDELVALGLASDPRRQRVIDPLAAVRAVTAVQSALESEGFDTSLNFSEAVATDDTAADATGIAPGATYAGTIVNIPAEGIAMSVADEDWYRIDLTGPAGRAARLELEIISRGVGSVSLPAPFRLESRVTGPRTTQTYSGVFATNEAARFPITGQNATYLMTPASPTVVAPDVAITEPSSTETVCSEQPTSLAAAVGYAANPALTVADEDIAWTVDGVPIGTGARRDHTFSPGPARIAVVAFGDPAAADERTVLVDECIGSPPTVEIINLVDGTDPDAVLDGDSAFITLEVRVTDPDETIADNDIVWTTDQGAVQPGGPSSGVQVLARGRRVTLELFTTCTDGFFGTVDHTIEVTVTDGQRLRATDSRVIRIRTLC